MITFDGTKRKRNIVKHHIDIAELSSFFDGVLLTREDAREAYGELRFQSVGWYAGEMPAILNSEHALNHNVKIMKIQLNSTSKPLSPPTATTM